MSKQDLETKVFETEDALTKAKYMLESFMENYEMDSGAVGSIEEAISFASEKQNMAMSIAIIDDYLYKAIKNISVLEEGVC